MATDPDYAELREAVSGPGMWRHLEVFDRHPKEAGSPGERESLAHVEAELRRAGYATRTILHEAYISLPGRAQVVAGNQVLPCITHSFSRPSPAQGLTAPVVDLGAGDEAAFAAADLRGRIVLLDGIANPVMSRRASLAGAAGQLHVSPHRYRHEMCISPVWGSPGAENLGNLPSTVVVTVAAEDGAAIRERLARDPATPVTLHAEMDTGWRPTPILIADLPSATGDAEEPFILFSGHHDAWYEGVMDNGGANATMMEVARLCALKRGRWKRGLRVAVWSGHSQGRYSSSAWYADHHWEELERRALVHVNVDSTGGKGNVVVADTGAAAELRPLAREALRLEAGQEHSGRRMGRAGDQSFWGIGVPSMYGNMGEQAPTGQANASAAVFGGGKRLGHGTGWWWHTPHDRIDKMDEALLVRDTRIFLYTVWRLLTDETLPLDYAGHAAYLRAELESLQAAVGPRFDLSALVARAAALEARCTAFEAGRAAATGAAAQRFNATLKALTRILVPLDYTEGDRFRHDPATPQGICPALQPLRRLAAMAPDDPMAKFLASDMVRARNRVGFALKQAIETLDAALAA